MSKYDNSVEEIKVLLDKCEAVNAEIKKANIVLRLIAYIIWLLKK